jgi:hypothetical protein
MQLVKSCVRFPKCSVNNCPLHSKYPYLYVDESDAEKKCHVEKSHRLKIAAQYPSFLKYDGLTTKEYGVIDGWTKRTDERLQQIELLENARNKLKS